MSQSNTNAPTWANLFGETSYHEVPEGRSVLSPVAYFMDLMRVIQNYITVNTSNGGIPFATRRPDLAALILDDLNTFTEVPKLQIVNQVLQGVFANDPELNTHIFPFNLPYDHQLERIRAYLAKNKTSWSAIQKELNGDTVLGSVSMALEILGLSDGQWQIVNTALAASDASTLATYFGYQSSTTSTDLISNLTPVDTFLQQTGLAMKQLQSLINQDLSKAEISQGLQGDFFINGDNSSSPLTIQQVEGMDITVKSEGFDGSATDVFGTVQISVNDQVIVEYTPVGSDPNCRGMHVVQVDPQTGKVLDIQWYDTWVSAENATAMTTYITSIPKGTIVLMAVVDDAANYITVNKNQNAINAIEALGSTQISNLAFRDSWAFIGVQGGNAISENLASGGTEVTANYILSGQSKLSGLSLTSADKINRFTRLSNAIGWSFADLDWAVRTCNPSAPVLDKTVLPYLAWMQTLKEQFGLSINQACAMIGTLKDVGAATGQTFFESIYSNPNIPNTPNWQTNGDYNLVWSFPITKSVSGTTSTSATSTDQSAISYTNTLAVALQMSQSDLIYIGNQLSTTGSLTLSQQNLAILYRLSLLPKLTGFSIKEVFIAASLLPDIVSSDSTANETASDANGTNANSTKSETAQSTTTENLTIGQALFSTNVDQVIQAIDQIIDLSNWIKKNEFSLYDLELVISGQSSSVSLQNQMVGTMAASNFSQSFSNDIQKVLLTKDVFGSKVATSLTTLLGSFAPATISSVAANGNAPTDSTNNGSSTSTPVNTLSNANNGSNSDTAPVATKTTPQTTPSASDTNSTATSPTDLLDMSVLVQIISNAVYTQLSTAEGTVNATLSSYNGSGEIVEVLPNDLSSIITSASKQSFSDLALNDDQTQQLTDAWTNLIASSQDNASQTTNSNTSATPTTIATPYSSFASAVTLCLQSHQLKQKKVLASNVASLLNVSVDIAETVIGWGDKNVMSLLSEVTDIVNTSTTVGSIALLDATSQHALLLKLQQCTHLINLLELSMAEAFYFKVEDETSNYPFTLERVQEIWQFKTMVRSFGDTQNNMLNFIQSMVDFPGDIETATSTSDKSSTTNNSTSTVTAATAVSPTPSEILSSISGWDLTAINTLTPILNTSSSDKISGFYTMYCYMNEASNLNVDVSTIIYLASGLPLESATPSNQSTSGTPDNSSTVQTESDIADQLWAGLIKNFGLEALSPLSRKLEQQLRNHLVPAVMNHFDANTVNALYEYLLIDVEVSGVVMTSLVKEAISAAQLYIYRCLHQQEAGVSVEPELSVVWTWMHAYREWQANREVLLYPENYIEPELRKNKTSLFTKLQNDLKQIDLTDETKIESVFREYINGFSVEAQLEIVSSASRDYLNGDLKVKELCLVGKTKSHPAEYYYRVAQFVYSGATASYQPEAWGEWQKINLKINAIGIVTTTFALGTWYVFWVSQKQIGSSNSGSSSSGPDFNPNWQKRIEYSYLNLSGKWTAAQIFGSLSSDNKRQVFPIYCSSLKTIIVPGCLPIVNINTQEPSTEERGLHVVQFDGSTCELLAYKHFDTYLSADFVTELVGYLNSIPEGDYVVIAASDDASNYINGTSSGTPSPEAVEAIENLGSTLISHLAFRDSWALIGQQGGGALAEGKNPGGTEVSLSAKLASNTMVYVTSEGFESEKIVGKAIIQVHNMLSENDISDTLIGGSKFGNQSLPDDVPYIQKSDNAIFQFDYLTNLKNSSAQTENAIAFTTWVMLLDDTKTNLCGSIQLQSGAGGGLFFNNSLIDTGIQFELNKWYFIAISEGQLYFQGNLVQDAANIKLDGPLLNEFSGVAQETLYFNQALTTENISTIFNNGLDCFVDGASNTVDLSSTFVPGVSMIPILGQPYWNIVNSGKCSYLCSTSSTSLLNLYRLGTSAVLALSELLQGPDGTDALLSVNAQNSPESSYNKLISSDGSASFSLLPENQIDFSLNSAMSNYYWELFFHAPFLIAKELYVHQQFPQAQQWYNYIFNPASQDISNAQYPLDKYWQFLGLRASVNSVLANELEEGFSQELIDDMNNSNVINIFETDSFDPQALADLRPMCYQRAVFLHYVNNLIGFGDKLFRENTRESIVEAEMFYVVAQDLLGKKPQNLGYLDLPDGTPFSQISTLNFRGSIATNELKQTTTLPDITTVLHTDSSIYLGTKTGLQVSTDSGKTWSSVTGLKGMVINCLYNDKSGTFAGTSNGLWQNASGTSWSQIPSCPISNVIQFANFNGSYNVVDAEGNNWYTGGASNLTKSSWAANKVKYSCMYFTTNVGYIGHLDASDSGTSGLWFFQAGKDWVQVQGTALTSISALAPSADGQTMYFAGTDATGNGFVMSTELSSGTATSLHWNGSPVQMMYHNGQYLFLYTEDQELLVTCNAGCTLDIVSSFTVPEGSNVLVDSQGMYLLTSDNCLQTISSKSDQPYFGIPGNTQILSYWDTLKQRLFDIRNGLNINGQVDQLPLFQPAINPEQLVAALSSGEGLEAAMSELDAEIPIYRFPVMIGKARELVQTVIQLGQSLLSALEKKDAHKLASLHQVNELNILQLTKSSKQDELTAAQKTVEMLEVSKTSTQTRLQHYQNLIANGLLPAERAQIALQGEAAVSQLIGQDIKLAAVEAYLVPNIFGFSDGGMQWGEAVNQAAQIADGMGNLFMTGSQLAGTLAGYQRREEDWQLQLNIAQEDLKQIELQILSAQYRQRTAESEITILEKNIQQEQKLSHFVKTKFTNEQLYQWYVGKLSGLYFQAYELAYEVALQAQSTWNFEQLGRAISPQSFIKSGYWNSLHQGLLAGESLELDLLRMEKSYTDQNQRRLEIEKTISLAQLDPASFSQLKTNGSCVFDLIEKDFDTDFPGHYCRQIKSLSISIPMIVGPYQNIHATLTQVSSKIIVSDDSGGSTAVEALINGSSGESNAAILMDIRPNQQIALSQGMNDSGLFTLNFNDERYLPFEGTGAVSSWQLDMPLEDNQIDFSTISDVIIKLRYTALQGSSSFKTSVKSQLAGNKNG